ncbi:hypothetical protein N7530_010554 [Penicillium desertorum]|uniref:Uncharacterized protein n=1 Tax=Penicillium desertorum TaxID=1303715 RepID=A0A9W9WHM0_9EURO|nr:hypothetical protein N7530_010554 [Penicillium desertorum]
MSRVLPLLHGGDQSLSTALDDDDNVVQELSYPERRLEFYIYLYQHRTSIESIVSYHMNLNEKQTCRVGEVKEWLAGSFNVCIPVNINGQDDNSRKRVLVRFPLPYKVGEIQHPGNADRSSAARLQPLSGFARIVLLYQYLDYGVCVCTRPMSHRD